MIPNIPDLVFGGIAHIIYLSILGGGLTWWSFIGGGHSIGGGHLTGGGYSLVVVTHLVVTQLVPSRWCHGRCFHML